MTHEQQWDLALATLSPRHRSEVALAICEHPNRFAILLNGELCGKLINVDDLAGAMIRCARRARVEAPS